MDPGSKPYPNMPTDPEAEQAAVEGLSVPALRRRKWCRFIWSQIQEGKTPDDLAEDHNTPKEDIVDAAQEWVETQEGKKD